MYVFTWNLTLDIFLDAFAKLRKATIKFVISVSLFAWNNWSLTGRIFMKFDICLFSEMSGKFKFHSNPTRITSILHGGQCKISIISRSFLLRMRNVTYKFVDKIKTYTSFSLISLFFENLAVYEIMWKNIVQSDRPQMIMWRMCIAYWIP